MSAQVIETEKPIATNLKNAAGDVAINSTPSIVVADSTLINCSFFLDSFQILNTRSLHEDTDYVGISLAILQGGDPNRMFQPVVSTRYMGSLNNGTYPVGLYFHNVFLADTDVAVFSYHITNKYTAGASNVIDGLGYLEQTLEKLPGQAVAGIFGSIPVVGNILTTAAGWLISKIFSWLTPGNCDGPVAAGVHSFTGLQLKTMLANGTAIHAVTEYNAGVDSNTGCGANSQYNVNFTVKQHV